MSDFELQMVHHAAPALLGMKQANLFSLPLSELPRFKKEVSEYQSRLSAMGISLQYLYCFRQRVFLLVYRKEQMLTYLRQPCVKAFLSKYNYPPDSKDEKFLTNTLAHLRKRICACNEFPHEIGFFLGYPISDVFSFIREKGQNYKLCGYWKVYENVSAAMQTFQRYDQCRQQLMNDVQTGASLFSLVYAS